MSPDIKIASSFFTALAVGVFAPTTSAASPLLSGYGGPGAGEQVIIGSALLNGPSGSRDGGSGKGGPSIGGSGSLANSGRQTGKTATGLGAETPSQSAGAGSTTGARRATANAGVGTGRQQGAAVGGGLREASGAAGAQDGFVYPREPSSQLASDSSVLGLSSGQLLLGGVVALALAVLGLATVRVVRLQR